MNRKDSKLKTRNSPFSQYGPSYSMLRHSHIGPESVEIQMPPCWHGSCRSQASVKLLRNPWELVPVLMSVTGVWMSKNGWKDYKECIYISQTSFELSKQLLWCLAIASQKCYSSHKMKIPQWRQIKWREKRPDSPLLTGCRRHTFSPFQKFNSATNCHGTVSCLLFFITSRSGCVWV